MIKLSLALIVVILFIAMAAEIRKGCCSSHGGACGCENGRVVCCDGTVSPSCKCSN